MGLNRFSDFKLHFPQAHNTLGKLQKDAKMPPASDVDIVYHASMTKKYIT